MNILNIFQLSNRRFCSACGAPEKTSDSSKSWTAVDFGVGPSTEMMTAKVQKPGTNGTGGGVVKGMTFYGIKGTCQGFSKNHEAKESESFFLDSSRD